MANIYQPPSTLKRILLIALCFLVIGAVGVGVVALLRTFLPKSNTPTNTNSSGVLPSSEIITAFKTPGAIKGLETGYDQQAERAEARVIYKAEGRKYTVSTPTKHSILFFAKSTSQPNDMSSIQEQATAFIAAKGYEKTENTGTAKAENPAYITYKSPIGACQLTSSQPATLPGALAYHSLACADSTAITQEYSTTEMLLTLYRNTHPAPSFSESSRLGANEDNKMLSIVSLSGDGARASLLFAAIDGNWEYIGDLGSTSEADSNGKYTVSAEMRSKINDTRYGNFLKSRIQ